jgi:hypothetical protein
VHEQYQKNKGEAYKDMKNILNNTCQLLELMDAPSSFKENGDKAAEFRNSQDVI